MVGEGGGRSGKRERKQTLPVVMHISHRFATRQDTRSVCFGDCKRCFNARRNMDAQEKEEGQKNRRRGQAALSEAF